MPLYSRKYRRGQLLYWRYKVQSNPLNDGRWDLKHSWGKKYDGLFYGSIKVKVNLKEVVFNTNYDPGYMKDIYAIITKSRIIGITKKQMIDAQIANKPKIKIRLDKLINKGQL